MIAILALGVLCLLAYSNTVESPFFFDDERNITRNRHIRIDSLNLAQLRDAGFASPASNRPVANISMALNYYLGRYETSGYRAVNIAIHLTNAILVYFLALTLYRQVGRLSNQGSPAIEPGSAPLVALLSAALFVAHPVQIQAVTYIVQRMTSLATLFFLLALLLYMRGRIVRSALARWLFFGGCILSWLLALGSKEIALTLPVVVLLYEWFIMRDLRTDWLKSYAPYLVAGLVACAAFVWFFLGDDPLQPIQATFDRMGERVLTQARVIVFYGSLIAFPHPARLNLLHEVTPSRSLIDPITTLLSVLLVVATIGAALWGVRRRRLIAFCTLWFFVTLSVESSVVGIAVIFEHRIYLPLVGCAWLVSALVFRISSARTRWPVVAGLGIVGLLALATHVRNDAWHDELSLWSDVVAKNPRTDRGHVNLALALESRGRTDEALEHFREALRIEPENEIAHNNLGNLLKSRRRLSEAIEHYRAAVTIEPGYANAHYNLGNALFVVGRPEEAVEHFEIAVELEPGHAMGHNNLATALARLGRFEPAVEHLEAAIGLDPDYAKARENLGAILANRGRLAAAVAQFSEVVRLEPDAASSHLNLGKALARQGELEQALVHLEQATRLDPTDRQAQESLRLVRARASPTD